MSVTMTLRAGDTSIDLSNYVLAGGFAAPPPAEAARTRAVGVLLDLAGDDMDATADLIEQIERVCLQARRGRAPYGRGAAVELIVRLGTTRPLTFDVLDGAVTVPVETITGAHLAAGWLQGVTLSLVCLPYARGEAITDTVSATLTNGTGALVHRYSVPGDAPALVRALVSDVSTNGAVIQGVHLFARSDYGLDADDDEPIIELDAEAPGLSTTDDSSYSGDDFARLAVTESWRTVASVTRPTARMSGLYDLWLRGRDWSELIGTPSITSATRVSASIRQVQSRSREASGLASVLGIQIPQPTTAGNTLVLVVSAEGEAAVTSITQGTWALADDGTTSASLFDTSGGATLNSAQVSVYVQESAPSHSGTIVVTWDADVDNIALWFAEYEGLAASSAVENVSTEGGGGPAITWDAVTTTQAYQLAIFAGYHVENEETGAWAGFQVKSQAKRNGLYVGTRVYTSAAVVDTNVSGLTAGVSVAVLVTLKAAVATAPTLTSGTYQARVAALTALGDESAASDPASFTTGGDPVALEWTAPNTGTPSDYRLYVRVGSAAWAYLDLGSTDTSYVLTDISGAVAGNPPDVSTALPAEVRASVGLSADAAINETTAAAFTLGNGRWEDVYLGVVPLPPVGREDGADPDDWWLGVQARHTTNNPDVDADLVYLMPHDAPYAQARARPAGDALDTARDWLIETNRWGEKRGVLRETGTTTIAGQLLVDQPFMIGPGDVSLGARLSLADGESDVTDVAATMQLTITPRWRFVRGGD